MNDKSLEIKGLFVVGIIIIVSFVYAINIQPVVFGTDTTFFPSNDDNHSYDLMSFRSYEEFSSFLNNSSKFSYNKATSPGKFLRSNIEIMEDSNFSVHADLEDIDFSQTNIQVQGFNEPDIVKKDGSYYIEYFLYINDVLLCRISDKLIKMNNLGDLSEINSIEIE